MKNIFISGKTSLISNLTWIVGVVNEVNVENAYSNTTLSEVEPTFRTKADVKWMTEQEFSGNSDDCGFYNSGIYIKI